jgi:hypothetical protein
MQPNMSHNPLGSRQPFWQVDEFTILRLEEEKEEEIEEIEKLKKKQKALEQELSERRKMQQGQSEEPAKPH